MAVLVPLGLAAGLVACGGSGQQPEGTAAISGRVDLPAGLSPTGLTVDTARGSATLSADGAFRTQAYADPHVATVSSAGGSPLLLGWMSSSPPVLGPRSTAEVLAFYLLGGFGLPSELHAEARTRLAQWPELDGTAQVIAGCLQTNPAFLTDGDAALTAELRRLAVLLGVSTATRRSVPTAPGRTLAIDPSGWVGGMLLDQRAINNLTITNNLRRRAFVFVDRDSYVLGDGAAEERVPDPGALTSFDLPPIKGVSGLISSLVDAFSGDLAYQPVTTDPLALPIHEGASSSRYTVTIVGPGLSVGDLDNCTAAQRAKQTEVSLVFFVRDMVLPCVLYFVVPYSNLDDKLQRFGVEDTIQDIGSLITTTIPDVADLIKQGKYGPAFVSFLKAVTTSGTVKDEFTRITLQLCEKVALNAGTYDPKVWSAQFERAMKILKCLTLADTILVGFDQSMIGLSLAKAHQADIYTVDAVATKVRFMPDTATVYVGGQQQLDVSVTDEPPAGDSFEYRYTNTATCGSLGDGDVTHVNNFTSSAKRVSFTANASGSGTDTVTVAVYRRGSGHDPILMGQATATIKVTDQVQRTVAITPTDPDVIVGRNQTLSVTITPAMPTGAKLTYAWEATSNCGRVLNGLNQPPPFTLSNDNKVTYQAALPWAGMRKLLLGQDTATVTVKQTVAGRAEETVGTATVHLNVIFGEILASSSRTLTWGPMALTRPSAAYSAGGARIWSYRGDEAKVCRLNQGPGLAEPGKLMDIKDQFVVITRDFLVNKYGVNLWDLAEDEHALQLCHLIYSSPDEATFAVRQEHWRDAFQASTELADAQAWSIDIQKP